MLIRRLTYALALLGISLLAVGAHADTFTLTGGGGNWSNTATWLQNALPAVRTPGSLIGTPDTVGLTVPLYTVTMDTAIVEPVTLGTSCPSSTSTCVVDVTTGNLWLTGASAIGADARLKISGGTVTNNGTLTLVSSANLDWNNGTLTGTGTTAVSSFANLNANGVGGMTLTGGQNLNLFGVLIHQGSSMQLNNGASITIQSGGIYDLQTINGIGTNNVGSPFIDVLVGGIFRKTAGNFGSNINPRLNNQGTVRVTLNTLVITNGTHNGLFDMVGAGTGIGFSGTPTLQNGTVIQGTGSASFGNVTLTGAVTASNLSMDSFGAISGPGTIDVSGVFNWRGGPINAGATVNMLIGSTLNVTGESPANLTASSHISNQGTFNIIPGVGQLSITNGGHVTNNPTRTIDITGDTTINTDNTANPRIDNAGIITKSAGVGSASIAVPVNNSGTVSTAAGQLNLGGSGNHSGIFTAAVAGTKVVFIGGTHTFTAGTFTGSGGFKQAGGTLDVDAAIAISQSFVQAGGVITGNGSLTLSSFTWEGGTMNPTGGTAVTVLSGPAVFNGLFGAMVLSGRALAIDPGVTVNYTPAGTNYFSIDGGANLSNFGTFNINGDVPINSDQSGGAVFNNNAGANLTKNGGTDFSRIAAVVNNNGNANVTNGQMAWNGGGTNGGTINIPAPANILAIEDKAYSFSIGTLIGVGNLGAVRVDGVNAVLSVSGTLTVDNIELKNGKIVASALTIGKNLKWTAGMLQGPGTFTLAPGGVVTTTSPTATLTLDNCVFDNNATFNYDPAQTLLVDNNSTFNNKSGATFNYLGNGRVQGGSGTNAFNNDALVQKTVGAGDSDFYLPYNNQGTGITSSDIAGGSVSFGAGGSMTAGTLQTTNAFAELHFDGATFTITGGAIAGTGKAVVDGATLQVNVSTNATKLLVNSGIVDVAISSTFQITTLEWNGGTMQGPGTKRVFGGFISAVAPTLLSDGILTIPAPSFGYFSDNVNHLTINGTAKLNVESSGLITIASNGIIDGAPTARVSSSGGTLTKSNAATARIDVPIDFTAGSGGTINVTGGVLELGGGGTVAGSSGSIQISPSAELAAVGGTLNINASASLSGTGTFRINGGTVNVNTPLTFANLLLDAGVLAGTANVGLDGGKWTGGDMNGTGTTTVNAGKTFELSTGTPKKLRRNFTNDGTFFTQTLTAALTLENAAIFTNNGLVEWQQNTNFFCACTPTPSRFHNAATGTFQTVNASGTSNFLTPFDNDGTVDVQVGILNFLNGGTHTGDFIAGSNTYLAFSGPSDSFSSTATVTGDGAVGFNATSSSFAGTHTLTGNGQTIVEGSVTFTSASTINTAALGFRSGTIGGTSNFAITGGPSVNFWLSGTITGTGSFTLAPATTMSFDAATGPITLDGRTFTNNGTINYPATTNSLALTNSASINNTGTGTFDLQNDAPINNGPGTNTFVNGGTFTKTTGAGTTNFAPAFTNSNLVSLTSGTVSFDGGFTQSGGTTSLSNGNLASPLTINLNGGTLAGNGTITGNVSSAGSISPGLSPGGLTITGDYTQAAAGVLDIQLLNTTPISGYDQLNVTGTASLDGTINVTLIGGFMPSFNDTFDPLTFASHTGTFSTANLPTFGGGGSFTSSYQPTAYRLTAVTPLTDLSITKSGPTSVPSGAVISYTIVVTNNGANDATNVVVSDPTPARATLLGTSPNCNNAFPCNLGTINAGQSQTILATYEASSSRSNEGRTITNIASVTSNLGDPVPANNQATRQTTIDCQNTAPDRLSPTNGQTVPANGTLSWQGNGSDYVVFLGPAGTGCSTQFGTSTTESLPYSALIPGATYEWRVASDRGQCSRLTSACATFNVDNSTCTRPEAPVARVVGQQTSNKTYALEWDTVPGAVRYEVDEATNAQFTGATTSVVPGLSKDFKHEVTTSTAFFYRVRAFNDCFAESGGYSISVRVVIVPLVPDDNPGRNVNIPAGSQELVVQQVFIPGQPNQSLFFSATTDRPWLTVHPDSGPLPPQGVTVDVTADPRTLPNGTFTSSLIVTITGGTAAKNGLTTHGTTSVIVPISINLVTPVSPVPAKDATSQYAMVIPSIGHLNGINSFWQSDVRVTNAGFRSYRYRLTFTPTGGTSTGVKQTTITVDAGATMALDDIVRNWYGFGALGDNAGGMLEILPLDEPAIASAATVASSRTYNVTDNGTLGQFIPAVRFNSFIGQALNGGLASVLSLQQVAESVGYRTNIGVLEGSGTPASVLLSIFNGSGSKLLTVPMQLAAGEQRQLNSFLAQNGISLSDGRVEVQVSGGGGKVSAFASVIDNNTLDPLLVSGTLLKQGSVSKWVLPGVANIDNPVAHWRTDMRVFNFGASVQPATLTFYPSGGGASKSVDVTLNPGAVLTLDDVLSSKFGLVNLGGVVHVTTGGSSSLVVTGRTYNQTSNGTFGQFIPAVTPDEAVGAGGPTLHILQVEDSTRYRTNIGLAEVSGAPAVVELQVILPDLKFTPTVQVPLAANEFRQFSLLRDLALGHVYNARVTVRVISGTGRVTGYASVIDELTQDPTYVPAQK